jgi:hypothetical protein
VLTLSGAPTGLSLYVLVPARQVLPAGMPIDLFMERDGGWEPIEQRGEATADGQYIRFSHPGGRIAAGLSPNLQPSTRPVRTGTPTPLPPNPSIGIPTPVIVGGEFVTAPTLVPTPTPTRIPPTPTRPPAPKLSVTITGITVVRSVYFVFWDVTVKNTGNAPAERVYVDIRGPGSPADWHHVFEEGDDRHFNCRIVQGLAILGETRAECAEGHLAPGESATIGITGESQVVIGSGTRSVKVDARNNFPDAATATGSATFHYAQNPP